MQHGKLQVTLSWPPPFQGYMRLVFRTLKVKESCKEESRYLCISYMSVREVIGGSQRLTKSSGNRILIFIDVIHTARTIIIIPHQRMT